MSGAPNNHSVTASQTAGDSPAALSAARRVLVAATLAFLFLAAFASSAGLRAAMLLFATAAIAVNWRDAFAQLRDQLPRGVGAAFLAWCLLATISLAWSVDPAQTRAEIKAEIVYGAMTFAVFFIAASDPARWRAWWIALVAGTVAVILVQLVQDALPFMIARHAMDGGPGPYSTHLVLVAPILFALASPQPWGRAHGAWPLAIAFALLGAAAWFTGNRIVWIAFAAQLLTGALASRWLPRNAAPGSRQFARAIALATLAIAVAFAASLIERGERNYPGQPSVTSTLERDLRPRIWSVAWEKFREAPWLGHGFGREVLADTFIPLTPASDNHPQMRHAHNIFMDIALQLGIPGLAIFVALLAALAREYALLLRAPALAPIGIMGLALIAGFVVKNQTDDFLHRHNALVFWALNAMLLGLARAPGGTAIPGEASPRPAPSASE